HSAGGLFFHFPLLSSRRKKTRFAETIGPLAHSPLEARRASGPAKHEPPPRRGDDSNQEPAMPTVAEAFEKALLEVKRSYKQMTRFKKSGGQKLSAPKLWKRMGEKHGAKGILTLIGHSLGMFFPGLQVIYLPTRIISRTVHFHKK